MKDGLGEMLQDIACFCNVTRKATFEKHVFEEVPITTFHDETVPRNVQGIISVVKVFIHIPVVKADGRNNILLKEAMGPMGSLGDSSILLSEEVLFIVKEFHYNGDWCLGLGLARRCRWRRPMVAGEENESSVAIVSRMRGIGVLALGCSSRTNESIPAIEI